MKPIFSRHEHINGMAFLNWRMYEGSEILNLLVLADGFMQASIELATQCLVSNKGKRADAIIFPILTNANHSLELYLKGILWTLNKIIGSDSKIEGRHNVRQIFSTVRARIKSYKGQISLKRFDELTLDLNSYLEELSTKVNATPKDDKMGFSRYPFSNSYEDHFYVSVKGNEEVDLENFVNRFKIIHDNLEEIATFLYDQELMRGES